MPRRRSSGPPPPRVGAGEAAVRLLARSSLTASELDRRLERKGYSRKEREGTLAELRRTGAVDDRRVAYNVMLTRPARMRIGRERILAELRARGVSDADLEAAWAEAESDFDEEAVLQRAVRMMLRLQGPPVDRKGFERLAGRLARRGFRSTDILRALEPLRPAGMDERNEQDVD